MKLKTFVQENIDDLLSYSPFMEALLGYMMSRLSSQNGKPFVSPGLLPVKECSVRCGVSRDVIYRAIKHRQIPFTRDKTYLVSPKDVERLETP